MIKLITILFGILWFLIRTVLVIVLFIPLNIFSLLLLAIGEKEMARKVPRLIGWELAEDMQ